MMLFRLMSPLFCALCVTSSGGSSLRPAQRARLLQYDTTTVPVSVVSFLSPKDRARLGQTASGWLGTETEENEGQQGRKKRRTETEGQQGASMRSPSAPAGAHIMTASPLETLETATLPFLGDRDARRRLLQADLTTRVDFLCMWLESVHTCDYKACSFAGKLASEVSAAVGQAKDEDADNLDHGTLLTALDTALLRINDFEERLSNQARLLRDQQEEPATGLSFRFRLDVITWHQERAVDALTAVLDALAELVGAITAARRRAAAASSGSPHSPFHSPLHSVLERLHDLIHWRFLNNHNRPCRWRQFFGNMGLRVLLRVERAIVNAMLPIWRDQLLTRELESKGLLLLDPDVNNIRRRSQETNRSVNAALVFPLLYSLRTGEPYAGEERESCLSLYLGALQELEELGFRFSEADDFVLPRFSGVLPLTPEERNKLDRSYSDVESYLLGLF